MNKCQYWIELNCVKLFYKINFLLEKWLMITDSQRENISYSFVKSWICTISEEITLISVTSLILNVTHFMVDGNKILFGNSETKTYSLNFGRRRRRLFLANFWPLLRWVVFFAQRQNIGLNIRIKSLIQIKVF